MVFYFPLPFDARGASFGGSGRPRGFSRGNFVYPLYVFLKFYLFPSTRSGRAGPLLFCSCRKVSKRQAQGSFTPLRIPGPKWGAGRPPLETPKSSLARQRGYKIEEWPNSSPLARLELRCRWGKRERLRARPGRRTSTASFGGFAPLPPTFSKGKRSPVTRLFWGLRPLAPKVPKRGRLPIMRARAWYRAR